MRFPRFTLRRLMAVVAVAALALGLEMGRRRSVAFLALAKTHQGQYSKYQRLYLQSYLDINAHRAKAAKFRASFFVYWPQAKQEDELADQLEADSKASARLAEYHRRMREKYRRAARSWFEPVEPDPPAPPTPGSPGRLKPPARSASGALRALGG